MQIKRTSLKPIWSIGVAALAGITSASTLSWVIHRPITRDGLTSVINSHVGYDVFTVKFLPIVGASLVTALLMQRVTRRARTRQLDELVGQRTAQLDGLNRILMCDIGKRTALTHELQASRAHLRELIEHNTLVKEEERKRIAREIHDELGQSMLALKLDLSHIASVGGAALREPVGKAIAQVDQSMRAMRMIINELRPAVLDLGLDAAIEWELSKFTRRTDIKCIFGLCDIPSNLSDELVTAMYRIAQESLTNVAKHARATEVEISLWHDREWLFMSVLDNGIGMQCENADKSKSFGLIGIRERVYALGGSFDTSSSPGRGTRLLVTLPWFDPSINSFLGKTGISSQESSLNLPQPGPLAEGHYPAPFDPISITSNISNC